MAADDFENALLTKEENKLKPPPMYKVLLLNDDFTPMEFVVIVLQKFFSKSQEQATQIMLQVHMDGVGVCGVYSADIAITKVGQVDEFAKKNEHPLKCVMEEN